MLSYVVLILAVISTLPNAEAFFVYRGSSFTPGSWVKNSLNIHLPSLRRPPRAIVVKHVVVNEDVDGSHPQQPAQPLSRRQPVVDANAEELLFANALQQADQDDGKTEHISNGHSNNVIVRVEERNLPISPFKAKEAWNKFVWRDSTKRMILWPLLLQEEQQRGNYVDDGGHDEQDDIFKIHSQLVNMRALQLELQPQHSPPQSLVSFAPCSTDIGEDVSPSSSNSSCCHLTWQVQLTAKHPQVVHAVASFLMTSSVNEWMDAMIATPRLLHRQVVIPNVAVDTAVNAWLDFAWTQGGGLPLPFPPIQLPRTKKSNPGQAEEHDDVGDSAGRCCRRRIIIPPGLSESIVSITTHHHPGDIQNGTTIRYQVDNPGILTYPVHVHQGLVQFSETTATADHEEEGAVPLVQLDWLVEIRPIRQLAWFVEAFTESVVTTLTRNLAVHLSSTPFGSAMVQVKPPRGHGGKSFASVRKDSWLGGVLEAHLRDDRSTFQQTLSILQPWTWGRATDDSLLKHGLLRDAHTAWSSGNLNKTMTAITSDKDSRWAQNG